jgi:hypothetical protein
MADQRAGLVKAERAACIKNPFIDEQLELGIAASCHF